MDRDGDWAWERTGTQKLIGPWRLRITMTSIGDKFSDLKRDYIGISNLDFRSQVHYL